jgi:ApeA N-terminal domain 1
VDDRRLEGYWWLPGHEDDKIAGILTYDGTDPSLRVLGAFRVTRTPGVFSPKTREQAPLILGSCEGEAVTLLDCRERRSSLKVGATDEWRQTLDARLMLVGIWLDEPDEQYFNKIVIGIDHLLPWSRQSGLERTYEQSDGHWSTSVKWDDPNDLTACLGDTVVGLRLGCNTKRVTRADRTQGVHYRARRFHSHGNGTSQRDSIDRSMD